MAAAVSRVLVRAALLVLLAALGSAFLAPTRAHAGSAWDGAQQLTQPDGRQIQARLWGDEFANGWETLDGNTIVRRADGWWVFAGLDAAGEIVPSQAVVGKVQPPASARHARPTSERIKREREAQLASIALASATAVKTGTFRVPIIVVSFADDNVSPFTKADFDNVYFGKPRAAGNLYTGPGSLRDYFAEVSYGRFHLEGGTTGVIMVKLPRNRSYYMSRESQLVGDALRNADRAGVDFAQFDNDGDGVIDVVAFLYAGCGPADGCDPTAIWPHYIGFGKGARVDGKEVLAWTIQPAEKEPGKTIAPIGMLAHELGHAIGLPDLYDADGGSEGIGRWGLMGNGNWLGLVHSGDSPAHLSAWSKSALDWLTPTQVTEPMVAAQIPQVETSAFAYQFLDNPNGVDWRKYALGTVAGTGEYFLVENRAKVGFDKALPGAGLLVWHVDESVLGNTNPARKLVDLEEADGLGHLDGEVNTGDAGDPYPGSSGNRYFGLVSNPNSLLYSGASSGVTVWAISDPGSTMTAHFLNPRADLTLFSGVASDSLLDGKAVAGEKVTYTVWVRNLGPQNTVGVKVHDVIPAGTQIVTASATRGSCAYASGVVTCDVGALASQSAIDDSDEVAVTVVVRVPSDFSGSSITNAARVTSDITDPNVGNNEHSLTTDVVRRADLDIRVQDAKVVAGNDVTIYGHVTNHGPSDAKNAMVIWVAPDGLSIKSWSMEGWKCSVGGSTLICSQGVFAAHGAKSYNLVLSSSPSLPHLGEVKIDGVITSLTVDPNTVNNGSVGTVSVERKADLHVAMTPSTTASVVVAGTTLTYRLTVSNLGPSDASLVKITDTLPSSYATFVRASPECPSITPKCEISGNVVSYEPGDLSAGGTTTLEVTVLVDPATPVGTTLTNSAHVVSLAGSDTPATPDPVAANNGATHSVPVTRLANLSVLNQVSAARTVPGGPLEYTVIVRNQGPSEALDVRVSSEASGPVSLQSTTVTASPQGTCSATKTGFTCSLGAVAPGATVIISINGVAASPGTITSVASVKSPTHDRELTDNQATAVTTVEIKQR